MRIQAPNSDGFSLVELVCVMGIISILASMAMSSFDNFVCKARQAEARTNLSSVAALEHAYYGDHGEFFIGQNRNLNLPRCGGGDLKQLISCIFNNAVVAIASIPDNSKLTVPDSFSSKTSCNKPNDLGFQISDCTKTRYNYTVVNALEGATTTDSFTAYAREATWNGQRRVCPNCTDQQLHDGWGVGPDGIVRNAIVEMGKAYDIPLSTCPFSEDTLGILPPGC